MFAPRRALLTVGIALALAGPAAGQAGSSRGGYSYVREVSGEVTVVSRWNGEVQASRNMPISVGDAVDVDGTGRAEIALADGNVLYLGGGTRARFASIRDQQGEDDNFSMVSLEEGSLILAAVGSDDRAIPRIDTQDATVYVSPGGRARVNYDSRHGTVVISRAGTSDVRTRDGSYRVRAGEYLMVEGEEEPEIQRGAFSRDRFDTWAADRFQSGFEVRSASAEYVDEDDSGDVVALDGYGDWSYNNTYGSYVWRPRVAAGWTPYSNGSWYYTPIGQTWWSYDPWGWYPFHYGNWFFDASFSSWCWSPANVYSPAWVYWGYSSGYVGWCPVGWYSGYSPWHDNYYRQWGYTGRGGVYLSVHGTFPARNVDFRGWNFVGAGGFGATARMDVIPGSRIGGRLGGTVAVSSRPMVVTARPGETRQAVQNFIREAPRVIERTASGDSTRLGPVLARERNLPPATVEALRGRAVLAEGGRLAGPGVADIAPRGALVDRTRTLEMRGAPAATPGSGAASGLDRGSPRSTREVPASGGTDSGLGRSAPNRIDPRTVVRGDENGVEARTSGSNSTSFAREEWRAAPRSREPRPSQPRDVGGDRGSPSSDRGREAAPSSRERSSTSSTQGDWRSRPRSVSPRESQPQMTQRSTEDWRTRSTVPPARRVIEGSVPGRQVPDGYGGSRPSVESRSDPRSSSSSRSRDYRSAPSAPQRDMGSRSSSPSRSDSRPQAPRSEVRQAPSQPSRMAPQPAPRSAPQSAPRSAPAPRGPRT
jgi:hypothetical protein